jgi:hypothetical protein
MNNFTRVFVPMALSLLMLTYANATDYYVSLNGNDNNAGTSAASAWQTISKVNSRIFAAGDRVLFQGGHTFNGTLQIDGNDGGTIVNPVILGSYGSGRATINGAAKESIIISGATGVLVTDLNATGLGRNTGNSASGIVIAESNNITVNQVDVSGFQHSGISFYNSNAVDLIAVYAHDNGFAGISSFNVDNCYVGYCRALNNHGDPTITTNHSGNGIVLSARNTVVEYCEAAYNGYDMQQINCNGPVGIWCWESDKVTIQYCISHNNSSPCADGGGFDFDGGVTNSVMQYNYAYENKNYGFLAWEYGSSIRFANNVFRYNISVNNYGPEFLFGKTAGQGINDTDVYNNIFYSMAYQPIQGAGNNVKFRNNILVGSASGSLVSTGAGLIYQGNCYWSLKGGFNIGGYTSLQAWSNATGQEKVNNQLVGIQGDPLLSNPANYEKLTDPTQLPSLTAFLLSSNSPVINKGLTLSNFSIQAGSRDFYCNATPHGGSYDIGAQEFQATSTGNFSVANPSFENDNAAVQSPTGWSTWGGAKGTGANADYTEAGGAHTGNYHCTHKKNSAYEVYTYQLKTGLINGVYRLRAWVKSSGGQPTAIMLAKNYGGAQLTVTIPTTSTWMQIDLPGISVTNGQCEIGFYSIAKSKQYISFDDIELIYQSAEMRRPSSILTQPISLADEKITENTVHPNPFQSKFTFDIVPHQRVTDVKLIHASGSAVNNLKLTLTPHLGEIEIQNSIPPGLYLLKYKTEGAVKVLKVIKE